MTTAPAHSDPLNDLADIYIARGDTQAALDSLRLSHAAQPYNLDSVSGLCFYTAFYPHADAESLFTINRDWSRRLVADANSTAVAMPAVHNPGSRIRVGYLAYDLFDHVTS